MLYKKQTEGIKSNIRQQNPTVLILVSLSHSKLHLNKLTENFVKKGQ